MMRCDDIKITISMPVPIDKPNGNGRMYTEEAIRKAYENASGQPLIQFNDKGEEVPIGVVDKVEYSNGFIWVEARAWHGGTNDLVEMLNNKKITSFNIGSFGLCE